MEPARPNCSGAFMASLRRRVVLLIGHNPGLQDLALELAGNGDSARLAELGDKFPTGALASLACWPWAVLARARRTWFGRPPRPPGLSGTALGPAHNIPALQELYPGSRPQ